ncbi:hypothetical protein QZH41_009982 [Actinostola sp. cb2023]|nr:hypothetical protein QZH41_009982 [Actinostola sp. cb2023]
MTVADGLVDVLVQEVTEDEQTDKILNEKIAKVLDNILASGLSDHVLTKRKEDVKRPENCKLLRVTKVNTEIWDIAQKTTRSMDARIQKMQESLIKGLIPLAYLTGTVGETMEKKSPMPTPEEADLDIKYKTICSSKEPVGSELFGDDLTERLKTVKESAVLDFLQGLYDSGLGYSCINTARSALSTLIVLDNNVTIGTHPLVQRFVRGVFQARPALPKQCSDSLKESIASALRHTRKQSQTTYDRRTANEKKKGALSPAEEFVRASSSAMESRKDYESGDESCSFGIGDFVALLEQGYLGFLKTVKNIPSPQLQASIFQNGELVQSYLNYLDNASGKPFSASAFTKHLKQLFFRLTGTQISINALRSSFITYAYSQTQCSDSLKESIASALRHTRKQSQTTYDRRTANEKKKGALSPAEEFVRASSSAMESRKDYESGDESCSFGIGDFVALAGTR